MKKVVRLFAQFVPENYKLDIAIDPDKMTFEGSVVITGRKVGRPSKRLTFNQSGLKITKALVTRSDKKANQEIAVDRINHHASLEEVRLHSSSMLYPGNYAVTLQFKGKITPQMNGIYPCFFKYKGQEKKLIATQFESHHAREVFPCIDEPEAKATFDLGITAPAGETVLSNTPIKEQEVKGSNQKVVFETTPKMSTYLLAFIIGELGYKEAKTKDGIHVRTYATNANVQFTAFALEVAVKCLDFFNDYFGIKYPLEKCDLIALPDFASGAMENWGCITFREQALLVDPQNSTLANKQYVALVVAHELAHQWFGNLVTMRWWTDLWLNEGFASWIEYLAVDKLFPDWQMWTQFVVDEQQQALKLDALENTHPVEVAINHPDEIRTIFDAISYSKGSSVIHMLHNYLGAEAFRAGLRYYLKKHEYGNTDTVDLWQAMEEASKQPVRSFMHGWTSQTGFPLLQAEVGENEVQLSQQRFTVRGKAQKNLNHSQTWPIPLLAHDDKIADVLSGEAELFPLKDSRHFKLNSEQGGLYRTVYNAGHVERLAEQIKEGHLSPLDRLGLLNDLAEAAKAGYVDTLAALHLLEAFKQEHNYAVWDVMASFIGSLRLVMDDEDLREAMKPYIRQLVTPQLERLGWVSKTDETHFDTLMRPIVLGLAASADEPSVVKQCQKLFAAIKLNGKININPDLRGVVFGTVARHGNSETFQKLVALHNNATLSEERTTLCAAITGFKQPQLVKKALSMITTKDVRLQDAAYWIAYSFMNRHGKKLTWQWLLDHWDWLEQNLGTDLAFYRMPIYAGRAFSDHEFLKEYSDFFHARTSPALERSIKQGTEMIEWQAAWKGRDLKTVKSFFRQLP